MITNGVVEHSTKNSKPQDFSDVMVWDSVPGYTPHPSYIRNLIIQTVLVIQLVYIFTMTLVPFNLSGLEIDTPEECIMKLYATQIKLFTFEFLNFNRVSGVM